MSDYWISDAHQRVLGPISLEVLRTLLTSGRLRGLTQVSRDGRNFAALQSFPEVVALIQEAANAHQLEYDRQEARKLAAQIEALRGKPVHEVFNLPENASIDAYRASFFSLVKRFYPARLPNKADEELRNAYRAMFSFLSQLMAQIEQRAMPPVIAAPASTPPAAPARPAHSPTYSLHEFVGWERRDGNRVHVSLRVTIESVSLFTLGAVNISNGGVFLAMEKLVPLGERLEMTIHFDTPARQVSARGVVTWVNERGDMRTPRGVGVRFTSLDEEDRRFIAYYVKKAQARTS
jgi:uncharacterized protein (TIGR02266 family)